jgi:hypothetical protein
MSCDGNGHWKIAENLIPVDGSKQRATRMLGAAHWATSRLDISSLLADARVLDRRERLIVSTPGRDLLPESSFDTFLIEDGRITCAGSWKTLALAPDAWTTWRFADVGEVKRLVGFETTTFDPARYRINIEWEARGSHEWPTRVIWSPLPYSDRADPFARESVLRLGAWISPSTSGGLTSKEPPIVAPPPLVAAWNALPRPGRASYSCWKGEVEGGFSGSAIRAWFECKSIDFALSVQRTAPCMTTFGASVKGGRLEYPASYEVVARLHDVLRCWATMDPSELRSFEEEFPTIERVDTDGTTHVAHPLIDHVQLDPDGRIVLHHREFGRVVCIRSRGNKPSVEALEYGESRIELGKRSPDDGPAMPAFIRLQQRRAEPKSSATFSLARWKAPKR